MLLLLPGAAGCITLGGSEAPFEGGVLSAREAAEPTDLPDPIAIGGGDVIERNPTNATLRW
ncbi:MAG TPA: hypothetical protein VM582_05200, partial [Candidatus Thermoplasmatota archaeon]|nr:hypothetical protein [Candidatus Thermoplasmatota archaeon]